MIETWLLCSVCFAVGFVSAAILIDSNKGEAE
jgi:hypothetical protein